MTWAMATFSPKGHCGAKSDFQLGLVVLFSHVQNIWANSTAQAMKKAKPIQIRTFLILPRDILITVIRIETRADL